MNFRPIFLRLLGIAVLASLGSCSDGSSTPSSSSGSPGSGGTGGSAGAGGSSAPTGGSTGLGGAPTESGGAGGSPGTGGAPMVDDGGESEGSAGMPPSDEGDWPALQSLLAGISGVATAPIAGIADNIYFTPGMLLGNGDLGVVVGGDTNVAQKFYFGKTDFWGNGGTMAGGATGDSMLSLGSLTVRSSAASTDPSSVYRMVEDVLNAEVRTTLRLGGTTVDLRSWTGDTDNVFVTELSSAAGSAPVEITVDLAMPNDNRYPFATGGSNGILWATRANNLPDYVARAAIAVTVVGTPLTAAAGTAAQASGTFTLTAGSKVDLVAVVRSDARIGAAGPATDALRGDAVAKATALVAADVGKLSDDHRAWWKDFWLKSFVRVNDATLENFYYGGLYVLGSACRPGKLPPSLWGSWVPNDLMRWGGRYFLNYNEQSAYYGVFSSNRPDLVLPYSDVILHQLAWQRNITHAAGYQGATFQRTLTPYNQFRVEPAPAAVAGTKNGAKLPADQKSNGMFAALPLIWYWEYTRDEDYLKNKLYPFLKELDAFYRAYATFDGTRYVIEHSSAHEGSDDTNPNLDVGFMRRGARTLLDASTVLGVDADLRPVWQDELAKLSKYPTGVYNGKTVYTMAEAIRGATTIGATFQPGDQPINMEGGVFPGENIFLGGDAAELQVAMDSVQAMNAWGVTAGGNSNNGFVKEFAIAARVGWPAADLVTKLKAAILYTTWRPTNLTHAQGGGGVETSGTIEAIDSMLMQSEGGVVRLFPVWPATSDAYFKRLRAKGAFLVSSELKGGQVTSMDVTSEMGNPLTVKNPWANGTIHADALDATGAVTGPASCMVNGENIACMTTPGARYRITSGP